MLASTRPRGGDRAGSPGLLGALGSFARGVQHLAPVWVPCVLCAQIALLGLRPALAEQRRLEQVEVELLDDRAALLDTNDELDRMLRAQGDAIFVARKERKVIDPEEHTTALVGHDPEPPAGTGTDARP